MKLSQVMVFNDENELVRRKPLNTFSNRMIYRAQQEQKLGRPLTESEWLQWMLHNMEFITDLSLTAD